MIGRQQLGIALIGSFALLACGGGGSDSTAPQQTTIEFHVTTTGVDLDADGFTVAVDGQPLELSPNGTRSVNATPGTHTLAVSGFDFNCDLTSAPATANAILGTSTRVDIQVSCTPYLRNAIVYISSEFNGAVMAMRSDGSRRVQLTNMGIYATPAVSPDGQTIAVAYGSWDGIYVLDRFGKGRKQLIGGGTFDGEPAWSPDGTKLAFRRDIHTAAGDRSRIFIVNRDGSGLRQLTPESTDPNRNALDASPSWSPDGARVLFERSQDISIINVDGTGLVSTGANGNSPFWSPDGTHIAYQSFNAGNDGIWVMDMSFTPHRLTPPGDQTPRWSPDGSQLVFSRTEAGGSHIYKMQADGTGLTKLTTSTMSEYSPTWSPNL